MYKLIILFTIKIFLIQNAAYSHGGGTDALGCHNNRKTGDYHCHDGSASNRGGSGSSIHEDFYNAAFARNFSNSRTSVVYDFHYSRKNNLPYGGSIEIDIETPTYVIEGGKDTRGSLDSVQQAIFASTITNKIPAVAIYDTDNNWGVYEHRIKTVCDKLNIKFFWVRNGKIIDENFYSKSENIITKNLYKLSEGVISLGYKFKDFMFSLFHEPN